MSFQTHKIVHLWTQMKIFLMKSESFLQFTTTTFKVQKRIRTSFKQSMWHQWFNRNFMKLREYFLCTKKTKLTTLFYNFVSSVSEFDTHSREYHNTCVCIALLVNKAQRIWVLRQNAGSCVISITCMCCVTLTSACRILTQKRRNCWIKFFFCTQKYSRSFITLWLNHWCHMDYFNNVFTTFLGLECGSCIAVCAGSESSRISSKVSSFVFPKMNKDLWFGTTWRWVINDNFYFWMILCF